MTARIDRLFPHPSDDLDDEALLATYAFPDTVPWLRMNFVSSLDGAATRDGRSAGLGGDADSRVFTLLRRLADVVLVGAGTVRVEKYNEMELDEDAAAWRQRHGFAPQPTFALVSRSLDVDPSSAVFRDAPVRPIVYTVAAAPAERRERLANVADVVDAGDSDVALGQVRADLVRRGLGRIHSEGGPSLFGAGIVEGAIDELCLTLAPSLESGDGRRIADATEAAPTAFRLATLLKSGDELLLRYVTG
ncbi:hypothetical protein GCM10010915_17230 [Microbacterium faecale]|uniref:Bacterial bifunctional deaminase-reductase C-terminal domain-containing protein n=1 Tax=Microbacterium faecale TaxID=1804630 RepID=A0A916YAQ6_9MICO|nr:pyrimidine reductase family protein [Microbacterium faecale]GGD37018.1 hypothetical protein GCM10010915_17230 [Microbacterium faecale]